jgi:hypothetical protein
VQSQVLPHRPVRQHEQSVMSEETKPNANGAQRRGQHAKRPERRPLSYAMAVPAGVTLGAQPLCIDFSTPMAATAPNVAIVVSFPAFGGGNTNAVTNARGFRL